MPIIHALRDINPTRARRFGMTEPVINTVIRLGSGQPKKVSK